MFRSIHIDRTPQLGNMFDQKNNPFWGADTNANNFGAPEKFYAEQYVKTLPYMQQQNRFDYFTTDIVPWAKQMIGGLAGQLGSGAGGMSGSTTTVGRGGINNRNRPQIGANPVMDRGMLQQQVNASRAMTDATTQNRMQELGGQFASRGFGSGSPAMMALQNQLFAAGMGQNADNERELRLKAAGLNADHMLKAQSAQEAQYSNMIREKLMSRDIASRQQSQAAAQQHSLLGMLLNPMFSMLAGGF